MSIKSQEGHMRQLALLLTTDLGCIFDERESGPNGSKKAFLNVGKVFLRALAKDLGLHEVMERAKLESELHNIQRLVDRIPPEVLAELKRQPNYGKER